MNPIKKVSLDQYQQGVLQSPLRHRNGSANSFGDKAVSTRSNRNNSTNRKTSHTNQVVAEMKIALKKEGMGNYIDLMA
ncbi:MAG: hypothetical protein AB1454_00500 [Candidatus Auribacterota bacterium]